LVGFLGGLQVTPGGFALLFRRAPVRGHVTEALLDRQFLDFGGAFVGGAGRVVAIHRALTGRLVPLVGAVGGLDGALDVFLGDGLRAASSAPRRSSSWARRAA
jgi:hypothetical protein